MKKQFILFSSIIILSIINYTTVKAQCTNVGLSLNSTASTCQSNGTIGVTVTGADAPNLRMSDAEYNIIPVAPSSYSRPWAQATGGTLTNVPPGTYSVGMRAYCTASGSWTVHASTGNITVANSYTVPNVYFGTIRKTLDCPGYATGKVPIMVQNGRTPFVISMTAYPSTYTGPTSATITTLSGTPPSGSYTFENLPAGSYTFSVQDNCTYNTTLSADLQTVSANAVSAFLYDYVYMPSSSSVVQNDCQSVRVMVKYNASGNAGHDAYDYYFNNGPTYYEIAFNEDQTTQPTGGWQALPAGTGTTYMNYTLSVPFNTFKAQSKYVAVWAKLIGTNCVFFIGKVNLYGYHSQSITYSDVTCTDFTVSHAPSSASLYSICYPYQWQITANNGASTVVPWSSPVTVTTNQTAHNIPYVTGTRLEYKDASGETWTSSLMSSTPTDNVALGYGSNICLSASLPLPASGILSAYMLVSYSNGNFPIGTRIEYLSGPAGAPTPNFSDITTTTAISSVYPFSSTTYTSMPSPYPLNVPGTYSFRVTMPTCAARTYTTNPTFYRIVTPLSYTSTEDCNGLTVYPTGQIGTINGASSNTYTTYFSIDTAPAGAVVNKTAVMSGGSLVLPVSGMYTIKMMNSSGTGTCAASTMQINYTKKQLQLDVSVTSAYVCSGLSVGNIRIQGMNGSGSYTYELWSSDLSTRHLTNTAGTFSYGNAGQSFIIRVIDNTCGTSFDQSVNILDLSSAQIVYSGSQNNEFCEGSAIQLNCITLGQTSYTWSGPNGYTSTAQNPTIPNATLAMSGSYTVTVAPENCGLPMVQTIVIKVNPKPPLPTVTNTAASFCLNATTQTIAAITGASATSGSYAVRYYNSSGSSITPATTVPTSAATVLTYYVVQYNTSTGCESDQVAVNVTVHNLPAAPTVNPVSSICPNTSFSITVSPATSGYYYKVYSVSSGGTAIGQSAVNSGVISGLVSQASAASYYVSTINAVGCESASRTAVPIPILATVTPDNITVPGAQFCVGASATLTATSGLSSPTFRWYTSQTATTPFNTGATYVTPSSLTATTTYYISVSNASNCENAINDRQSVTVTVYDLPIVNASAAAVCQGTATTFTATADGGTTTAMTYTWVIAGATYTGTSNTYVRSLSTTSTYSVSVKNANGCVSTTTSPQTATVHSTISPSITVTESVNDICSGISVNFTSVISGGGTSPSYQWKVNSNNVGTGGTFYTYEPEHNDVVTCVLTSNALCASPNPVTAAGITMRVTPSVTPALNVIAIPD